MKCQPSWLCVVLYLVVPTTASIIHKRAAIDDCLSSLKVPVYASNSNDWNQAIKPFNLRVPFKPTAYAVPETVQHVQDAVSCGAKNGITVTAKSGGHSYGSHGLGGEDGHLIVDLKKLNTVTVNQTAQTAVIGAGGRLGNIALALYNQGKQATAHGTCPGVGIGGLSLHGGYGLISRMKGLTLDNILEANVVLANSTVVTVSDTQNTDLFWALRGAGAAFGIVTSFKFKTFTAPEDNIVFTYNLQPSNTQQLANMLDVLQNFTINTQPPQLNMRLFVPSQFTGVYYGNRSSFDSLMNPLLSSLGVTNSGGSVTTNSWLNTLTSFSNGALQQVDPYDTHETFYAKSLMPSFLPRAALTALADYYFTTARNLNRGWYLLIDMHGGKKSAVSAVAADATAYAHRNATFKMQFYDVMYFGGTYDPSWFSFLNGWVSAIEKAAATTYQMYINYADTNLNKSDAHSRYWGPHYEKLISIKTLYDPKKVFEGPQLVGS